MNRREFVAGLGGAVAWPLAAWAQQPEQMRSVGVLITATDENETKTYISTFTQALADLGWTDGRNVRMALRWAADINRIRAFAQELVGLQPDIILASTTPATAAVARETRTIPIVFVNVSDPVVSGIVAALNRPGGNITGYALYETPLAGSGLNCSWRSRRGSNGLRSCSIPTQPLYRFICPHLRRRRGRSRSSLLWRPFIATQRSKRPSSPMAASREAALPSCRMYLRSRIVRQSYRRRPETAYRRSIGHLALPERRLALLRSRWGRHLSSRRHLCRSHSARRQAGRSSGAVSGEIRDGAEPQDRKGTRSHHSAEPARSRRRGDRRMKRREFIAGLAAAARPLATRARQGDRIRKGNADWPGQPV
jgi:hypothetical protein